jgi:hypothetical protein
MASPVPSRPRALATDVTTEELQHMRSEQPRGLLYVREGAPICDTDAEIAAFWFAAAWPEPLFAKAAHKARQAGVRCAGGRR